MAGLDPLLLISVSVLLSTLLLIIFFLIKRNWDEQKARERTEALLAADRERPGRARRQHVNPDDFSEDPAAGDPNMGKKKLAKLQAKAERRAMREYEERERAERKEHEAQRQAEEEERRQAEKNAEKAAEEKARKARENEQTREEREYQKMKKHFEIIEEGFDQLDEEKFISYVKEMKIVYLDELGDRFHLRSHDAADRLKILLEKGALSGVIDTRGRFICITQREMDAVAKYINDLGRVSISQLADSSNNLIDLNPRA